MNIMCLIDYGFDTPNGSSHLVIKMIDSFLKAGHKVYLVESHSVGVFPDIPEVLQDRENFTYDIISRPSIARGSFVKRYLSGIKYEFDAKKRWKKHIQNMDVVIHQSHYTSPFAAMLLKKYKKKVVFNIYDIFPGEAYTNGSIKSKFVYNAFCLLQRIVYKTSDRFFTLTEDTKKTLISLRVDKEKIHVIPNWFDNETIAEVAFEHNTFAEEYKMDKNKHYIQYAGSIGVAYDFDTLLDVAILLKDRKDIVFQLVGEGLFLDKVKKRIAEESIENVRLIPWQPLDRLSEVYSACTLQIVPLRNEVIRNSFPSKILPLMACSRVPVIAVEKDSFFYSDINSNCVGIATPLGDSKALADSICKLIDDNSLRHTYEANAKKYVYERYTADKNIKMMLAKFEELQKEKE